MKRYLVTALLSVKGEIEAETAAEAREAFSLKTVNLLPPPMRARVLDRYSKAMGGNARLPETETTEDA